MPPLLHSASLDELKRAVAADDQTTLVVVDPHVSSLLAACRAPANFLLLNSSSASSRITPLDASVRLDWREDGPVVFVVRTSSLPACRALALLVRQQLSKKPKQDFRIVFIPRRSFRCEQVLQEEHVLPHLSSLRAVHFGFVEVERDVWSLEMPAFLRECKVLGDTSGLAVAARALLDVGPFAHVRSKGHSAKEVLDLYLRMKRESKQQKPPPPHATTADDGSGSDDGDDDDDDVEEGDTALPSEAGLMERGGPLDLLGPLSSTTTTASTSPFATTTTTLILLDRELDMIAPLSTPLTYESQLEHTFLPGLRAGFLRVPTSALQLGGNDDDDNDNENSTVDDNSQVTDVDLLLLGEDNGEEEEEPVYASVRHCSVTDTMRLLHAQATQLKQEQDQMHRTRNVEDLQDFVKRLPALQARKRRLSLHIALARRVQAVCATRQFRTQWRAERELIETGGTGTALLELAQELAAKRAPLAEVLRLLCLYCVVSGGFSSSLLDDVRQDLVHAYGFECAFTLDNLDRAGVLCVRPFHPQHKFSAASQAAAAADHHARTTRSLFANFGQVKQAFRLLEKEGDGDGAGLVFAGMAPLSVRLVELALVGGWDSKTELLRMVGDGPTICRLASDNNTAPDNDNTTKQRVILVVLLGGVCRAELTAFRALGNKLGCRIVVATTSLLLTSTALVEQLFHPAT